MVPLTRAGCHAYSIVWVGNRKSAQSTTPCHRRELPRLASALHTNLLADRCDPRIGWPILTRPPTLLAIALRAIHGV